MENKKVNALRLISSERLNIDKYDEVFKFNDGIAFTKKGSYCGFINESGEEIIPCMYDYCFRYNNYMVVFSRGKYGVYTFSGENIIKLGNMGVDEIRHYLDNL